MICANDYKHYNKIQSLLTLTKTYGLPVHKFEICETLEEISEVVRRFNFICTIRTDMQKTDGCYVGDYPFFKITDEDVWGSTSTQDGILSAITKGYAFIVTDGLRYDAYLDINCVFKIDSCGNFMLEYSKVNVPLRHMYRYPAELYNVSGNIFEDDIRDFHLSKYGGADLRIIKEFLVGWYEHMSQHTTLFGKYVEASTYNRNPEAIEMVCWEVR